MIESPLVYALVFFGLGFAAGIIVSVLFQAGRSRPPGSQTRSMPDEASPPPLPEPGSKPAPSHQRPLTPAQPSGEPDRITTIPAQETTTWVNSLHENPAGVSEQVSASPIESFFHSVRSSTFREVPKPQSMAAEIDAILQEKLPQSHLAGRVVRIEEQPDFGLLVVVDGEKYAGVGAVPDEAVQDLIKSAVAEWQHRQNPNPAGSI